MPPDTAVQNRSDTVSSTGTHLVTRHTAAENISTGIASLILSMALIASCEQPRDHRNQDQFHLLPPSGRSGQPLRPV